MWPISTRVNKPENDDASIVEPIEIANAFRYLVMPAAAPGRLPLCPKPAKLLCWVQRHAWRGGAPHSRHLLPGEAIGRVDQVRELALQRENIGRRMAGGTQCLRIFLL
jgi:hypothetical protein